MNWFNKFLKFITPLSTYEKVRSRDKKGRYMGDNPKTKKNEAYTHVKKKRGRPPKKK
jgi:hypothetical protein|tara:strand:+ start:714 stop:884 length:171 start_codon:yes stop_codon:yes gene_type:complete